MRRRTPFEIAKSWYSVESVHRGLKNMFYPVPKDVESREFAEWLTHQYTLAMSKGIQLGRDGSEDGSEGDDD